MGRSANRKWAKRRRKYARAKVSEKFQLWQLFGHHRKFWRAAAAVLCMAFVYTTAVHAAAIIGSQTNTNDPPRGNNWISFHHDGAVDLTWELEVDGVITPLEPGAHVRCTASVPPWRSTAIDCNMEIPVFRDDAVVRVRPLGAGEDWSNAWNARMIPCGYFVGLEVFRNIEWSIGQVGEACRTAEAPPPVDPNAPATPTNPRIVKP